MWAVETDNMPCSRTGYERAMRASFLYGFWLLSYAVVHEQTRLKSEMLVLYSRSNVGGSLTISESYLIAGVLEDLGEDIAKSAVNDPGTRVAGTVRIPGYV